MFPDVWFRFPVISCHCLVQLSSHVTKCGILFLLSYVFVDSLLVFDHISLTTINAVFWLFGLVLRLYFSTVY